MKINFCEYYNYQYITCHMSYIVYFEAKKCILEQEPNKPINEVLKLIQKNSYEYKYALYEHKINYDIAFAAIKKNIYMYNYIPEELRNKNYYINKFVVRKNGLYLKEIPAKFINREIINLSILSDSKSIKYVPKSFITNDMITYVVKNNPYNIKYIPNDLITKEILSVTKKSLMNIFDPLNYEDIPENFKDDIDIILKIASKSYCDSIKEKLKLKNISILILTVNPSLIEYVPNEFFDDFDYKMRLVVCNQNIIKFNKDPILNMLWNIQWNFDKYEKNYVEIIQNVKYLIYSTNFYKLLKILLNDDDFRKIIIDHLHLFVELINNDEELLLFFDQNNIIFYEILLPKPETKDKHDELIKQIKLKFPNNYIYFF